MVRLQIALNAGAASFIPLLQRWNVMAMNPFPIGRREAMATGASFATTLTMSPAPTEARVAMNTVKNSVERDVVAAVNGVTHRVRVDTRVTLLDTLRETLDL